MRVDNTYYSLKNATTATESQVTVNKTSETLYIDVSGTASACEIIVLGLADRAGSNWQPLGVINVADYSIMNKITAKGLYAVLIEGIAEFKLNLVSVTGGDVTAFCRMVGGE